MVVVCGLKKNDSSDMELNRTLGAGILLRVRAQTVLYIKYLNFYLI